MEQVGEAFAPGGQHASFTLLSLSGQFLILIITGWERFRGVYLIWKFSVSWIQAVCFCVSDEEIVPFEVNSTQPDVRFICSIIWACKYRHPWVVYSERASDVRQSKGDRQCSSLAVNCGLDAATPHAETAHTCCGL